MKNQIHASFMAKLQKLASATAIVHPNVAKLVKARKPGSQARSKAINKYNATRNQLTEKDLVQ